MLYDTIKVSFTYDKVASMLKTINLQNKSLNTPSSMVIAGI